MLSRLVKHVPTSQLYQVRNSTVGEYLYSFGFTRTRTRRMQHDDLSFRMQTPTSDVFLWDDYAENGCHEPVTTRTFVEVLSERDDAVVWDIGSKCGYFMMVAAQFVPSENIHVFDPERPHLTVIRENNDRWLDGRATVNATSVSDSVGGRKITGDEYATRNGPPDLVKIDVDGPEIDILRGMQKTIRRATPVLLVELHVGHDWEAKARSAIRHLDPATYDLAIVENHRDAGSTWRDLSSVEELISVDDSEQDMMLRCIPSAHESTIA